MTIAKAIIAQEELIAEDRETGVQVILSQDSQGVRTLEISVMNTRLTFKRNDLEPQDLRNKLQSLKDAFAFLIAEAGKSNGRVSNLGEKYND